MVPKDLISHSDAMQLLGVSRTKLWKLTRDGLLTQYDNPLDRREKLYSKAEVEALIPRRAKVA